ncbi:unnamed protein product [Trifolium pratense]|uniref:Uncharacterized protein n=1 Tax=Trifolium pratense TaxID=57577 RepID=A0ACB0K329_TRIPR|nr:unnamed protein product [Trifolium pratense]
MGEALFDLEQLLISKKAKLTPQEVNILQSCKSKAVRNFTVSSLFGGAVVYAATRKLSKPFRVNIAAGAGAFCGLWIFSRSLFSCADHILTLDGSILQKELANIMVTKYQNDPSLMNLISKHFYSERIYDDSTSNTPKLRWRYRNFFSDNAINGNRAQDHDSYNDSHDKSQGNSHNDSYDKSQGYSDSFENSPGKSENITDGKRTTRATKQKFVSILSVAYTCSCIIILTMKYKLNYFLNEYKVEILVFYAQRQLHKMVIENISFSVN